MNQILVRKILIRNFWIILWYVFINFIIKIRSNKHLLSLIIVSLVLWWIVLYFNLFNFTIILILINILLIPILPIIMPVILFLDLFIPVYVIFCFSCIGSFLRRVRVRHISESYSSTILMVFIQKYQKIIFLSSTRIILNVWTFILLFLKNQSAAKWRIKYYTIISGLVGNFDFSAS